MTIKRRDFLTSIGGIAGLSLVPVPTALAASTVKPQRGHAIYKNAAAPIATRVEDLLSRMTLEEKVIQMQCIWQRKVSVQDTQAQFSIEKAARKYPHGLGMIARPSERQSGDPTGKVVPNRSAKETAEYVNAAQKWAVEHTRLGIPIMMHEEALHGYAARDATSFPQAIGLASSFDPDMVTRIFSVAAREMRARGCHMALAPVVDIARDPRWGRIEETYGEDKYLCGEIGKAAVRGFSGDAIPLAPDKVFATLKHMAGHGQPESGTNTGPAPFGEHLLREEFLAPFEKIIRETTVRAVMPSYNELDGIPSHANPWLLKRVLRDEWRFDGVTISDYSAIEDLVTRHKVAKDMKEAAVLAMNAGVDIDTPDSVGYAFLAELVREKRLAVKQIDTAVRRILRLKFEAGLFENPYVDVNLADRLTASADAVQLAHTAATRSAVLLKNRGGLLPLDGKKAGHVLLIGTHARDTPIGGYSDVPRHVVSVYEGLRKESDAHGFKLSYAEGVRLTDSRNWFEDQISFTKPEVNAKLILEAVQAAKQADTIIMVLGDNEQTSREAWADAHLGDRTSLDLIGQQNDLAKAIFDLGKPTVALLLNGRPLAVNLLAERADALLECWYMGQETGHAVTDLLFGRANPGGKLPVSIARNVGQLPMFYNHKPSARRGYIDDSTRPLYPFGYGLSYTTFDISAPRLVRTTIATTGTTRVLVDVRNTGRVRGDEVVQIYVRDDVSSVTRPLLELKGFKRITLEPGELRTLTFDIGPADLQFYNARMQRVVEPGTFTVYAGANSVTLKSVSLSVT